MQGISTPISQEYFLANFILFHISDESPSVLPPFVQALLSMTNLLFPFLLFWKEYLPLFLSLFLFELDFELDDYDSFQEIILNLKEKFPDLIRNHEFCITSKEFKLDLYPNAYQEFK